MPALDCRIIPARSISRCETIWASLGFSRNKGRKYSESRIEPNPGVGRRTLGKTRGPVHRAAGGASVQSRRRRVRDRAGGGNGAEGPAGYLRPLPCRSGKLRVKIFFAAGLEPESLYHQHLARDSSAESKARQGSGRETRKPPDRPLASIHQCYHINYLN